MRQNPSLQVKEQKLDTLVTTARTESMLLRCHAERVQRNSNLYKGYIPKTVRNPIRTYVGIDLTPSHLSRLICYVYIFTASVCTFDIISISFFYMKHT